MTNKLPNKKILIWDLETSGLTAPQDKILEIGALYIDGPEQHEFKWVLDHGIEIPPLITEITGIDANVIKDEGVNPLVGINSLLSLMAVADINVTHNGLRFDIPFFMNTLANREGAINIEIAERLNKYLRETAYDTAVHVKASKLKWSQRDGESYLEFADRVLTKKAYGLKYNLALTCKEMGIDMDGESLHRAGADVRMTWEVYKKQIRYD